MNPTISVIITCYNQGKYIEEAIKSVLNQSFKNYEIILVDDGSTDMETIKLIENNKWKNVKTLRIENAGVSNARNYGIKNSSGKYIVILDGDDKLLPNFISKTVFVLESDCSVKLVTTGVRTFGTRFGIYTYPSYSLNRLLMQNLMVVTSVFRRIDFNMTSGFSCLMNAGLEDWDFWISLLKNGGSVYHIDEILFLYRKNKISRNSMKKLDIDLMLRKQIYKNHKEAYDNLLIDPEWIFEYQTFLNSKEYKLASLLLNFSKMITFLKSKIY